jgi:hypothetical protein
VIIKNDSNKKEVLAPKIHRHQLMIDEKANVEKEAIYNLESMDKSEIVQLYVSYLEKYKNDDKKALNAMAKDFGMSKTVFANFLKVLLAKGKQR